MPFGFGGSDKKKDLKTVDREGQRSIKRSERDIEREIKTLERKEKETEAEIKKYAKLGQKQSATTLAKSLVQLREQKQRLIQSKSSLSGMGVKMTGVKAQAQLAQTMGTATTALSNINKAVDAKGTMQTMQEFARQNEITNMQEDVMNDALAGMFDDDVVDEESEQVVSQVLAELNIEQTAGLQSAPITNVRAQGTSVSTQNQSTVSDAELERLIAGL